MIGCNKFIGYLGWTYKARDVIVNRRYPIGSVIVNLSFCVCRVAVIGRRRWILRCLDTTRPFYALPGLKVKRQEFTGRAFDPPKPKSLVKFPCRRVPFIYPKPHGANSLVMQMLHHASD